MLQTTVSLRINGYLGNYRATVCNITYNANTKKTHEEQNFTVTANLEKAEKCLKAQSDIF